MTQPPEDRERYVERERSTHVTEKSSSTGIAMIVGGLLVAVIVLYFLFAGFPPGLQLIDELLLLAVLLALLRYGVRITAIARACRDLAVTGPDG